MGQTMLRKPKFAEQQHRVIKTRTEEYLLKIIRQNAQGLTHAQLYTITELPHNNIKDTLHRLRRFGFVSQEKGRYLGGYRGRTADRWFPTFQQEIYRISHHQEALA